MKDINKLWMLCVLVLFTSCKVNVVTKSGELKYPALGLLLMGYQDTYFQDPENIDDMLRYSQLESVTENVFLVQTIHEFQRDQDDMSVRVRKGYVELLSGKIVLCSMPVYAFRQTSVLTIPSYLRGVHAFGLDKNPAKEEINQFISSGLKNIRMGYNKSKFLFLEEKKEDAFVMVEYMAEKNKLVIKNVGCYDYLLEYPYFKEMSDYFKSACEKFDLSRIVYATRLYFNE